MITNDLAKFQIVMSCPVRKSKEIEQKFNTSSLDAGVFNYKNVVNFLTGCDQAVVKCFEIGVSNQLKFNRFKIGQFIV